MTVTRDPFKDQGFWPQTRPDPIENQSIEQEKERQRQEEERKRREEEEKERSRQGRETSCAVCPIGTFSQGLTLRSTRPAPARSFGFSNSTLGAGG